MELGRRRMPTYDHEGEGIQKLDRQKAATFGHSQRERSLGEDLGTVGSLPVLYGLGCAK